MTKADLASFHDEITFSRTGFGRIWASPADFRQLGHSCLLARAVLMHCRKGIKETASSAAAKRKKDKNAYGRAETMAAGDGHRAIV